MQDEPVTIEVRDLARVHLNPGDVLAVRPEHPISQDRTQQIKAALEDVFPDNQIIITTGLDLAVITTEARA